MNETSINSQDYPYSAVIAPIPGDDPGGVDIRSDEEFARCDEVADRLVRTGALSDARELASLAQVLLETRSKDLKTMVHWIYALTLRDRFVGLNHGLIAMRILVEELWPSLWPRVVDRRRSTFEFFNNTFTLRLKTLVPSPEELAIVQQCKDEIDRIQKVITTVFRQGSPPSLGNLRKALEALVPGQEEGGSGVEGLGEPISEMDQSGASPKGNADVASWLDRLLVDLAGVDPAGAEDPRFTEGMDQPYERAENLFHQLTHGGGGTDWPELVEACEQCLTTQCKHLWCAAWLTIGLCKTKGLDGACDGLSVFEGMLCRFGTQCYPRSSKGRLNGVRLLNEHLPKHLYHIPSKAIDPAKIVASRDIMNRIADAIRKLEAENPVVVPLGILNQSLESLLADAVPADREVQSESAKDIATVTIQQESVPSGATNESSKGTDLSVPSLPAEGVSTEEMDDQLVGFCFRWREIQPACAVCYRLLRMVIWKGIRILPNADNQGRTKLSLQPKWITQVKRFKSPEKDAPPLTDEEIVAVCEGLLSEQLATSYWLDLNHLCYRSLVNLGPLFAESADAVKLETTLFVRRLPGIERLRFSNGEPFADDETLQWIEESLADLVGEGTRRAILSNDSVVPAEIVEVFAQQDIQKAMDYFSQWLRQTTLGPVRIQGVLLAARALRRRAQTHLARALLASLDEEMKQRNADIWIPDLCLEVWKELRTCNELLAGLYLAQGSASKSAAIEAANQDLLARLAKVEWQALGIVSED